MTASRRKYENCKKINFFCKKGLTRGDGRDILYEPSQKSSGESLIEN